MKKKIVSLLKINGIDSSLFNFCCLFPEASRCLP